MYKCKVMICILVLASMSMVNSIPIQAEQDQNQKVAIHTEDSQIDVRSLMEKERPPFRRESVSSRAVEGSTQIDPKFIVPGNADIDSKFIIPGNPNIDPKFIIELNKSITESEKK